jgi:primosomal protein N' (replication factor Y)
MAICQVLVSSPIDKLYDYRIPDDLDIEVGDYVSVPLGKRTVQGIVWKLGGESNIPVDKIKEIFHKYNIPRSSELQRDFIDWVANYNCEPRGSVLKMAISVPDALEPITPVTGYILSRGVALSPKGRGGGEGEKSFKDKPPTILIEHSKTLRQNHTLPVGARAFSEGLETSLNLLSDNVPRRLSEISQLTGLSPSKIKTLVKRGVLETIDIHAPPPCGSPNPEYCTVHLTPEQKKGAELISARIRQGGFEPFLLDGVTGAGKTEVYFEVMADILRQSSTAQMLILMPEIALSNSFITRFTDRFGCKPALWHSSVTPAQRRLTWRSIAAGQTRVVVGARSSLFLPYANLKMIVVDEEHDTAFKQEDITRYHARDMAVVRGQKGKIPVILSSATPSLETMHNVWEGKYTHLKLPDRFGGAELPDIHMIDLRVDKPERQKFLSPTLLDELEKNIGVGEQSLLFLNRRGFAPLTLCRTCGHRLECPKCTAWLVEHKRHNRLQCHHCGYSSKIPSNCPSCQDENSLVACGPGVERIAEEVQEKFPDARTLILASDITDTHDKLMTALTDIQEGRIDIIIGTQIIAKGHHFPKITCVGVVDADLGLSGGDLRASERTYQLLNQVSGRAGREKLKGRVYLQTYNPEQPLMKMIQQNKRDDFLEQEARERANAHMPPFSRLASIIITARDEGKATEAARALGRNFPAAEGVTLYGPAPAQMYRVRGQYRQRLLIRAEKNLNIQKLIREWIGAVKLPSSIRVDIDIDPQNFL